MKSFKQFTSGPEPREEPLRRYSVYRHHLNGLSHYDSYDNPHEAHMTAQLISTRHRCKTHIMDNHLGHSIGSYVNGNPTFNEEYIEEGKPKPLNPKASYHYSDIHKMLRDYGWISRDGGKHIVYSKPDVQQIITVPHGKGEMIKRDTMDIIKTVMKHVKQDD